MFVRPCKGEINSLYGKRIHPVTQEVGKMHWGVDFTSHADNTIVASAGGRVRVADHIGNTGFGKYVVITHSNGWETLYAHLASVTVKRNETVKQGAKIGVKGTTGRSTGVHLHFEMTKGKWKDNYTTHVNPLLYYKDEQVITIQEKLKMLGYAITVDGYYGSDTIKAVTKYQKANGLVADGVAGRGTMALLTKEEVPSKPKPPQVAETGGEKMPTYEKNPTLNNSTRFEFENSIKEGITNGEYPLRPATRQETSVMILRAMNILRKEFNKNNG